MSIKNLIPVALLNKNPSQELTKELRERLFSRGEDDVVPTLSFKKISNTEIEISSNSVALMKEIIKMVTISYTELVYEWRTKRRLPQVVHHGFCTVKGPKTISVMRGIAHILYNQISVTQCVYEINIESIDCDTDMFNVGEEGASYPASDKWLEVFANHPNQDYGLIQAQAYTELSKVRSGLACIFTGVGKTEILLAIAESHASAGRKVLIIAPSSVIIEEICIRGDKYGVFINDQYTPSSPINVCNPVGLCRSSAFKDQMVKNIFKTVDVIIADEAHQSTSDSWDTVYKLCDPDYVYGMTATPDTSEDSDVGCYSMVLNKSTYSALNTVSYWGPSVVSKKLPIPVLVYKVVTKLTPSREPIAQFQKDNPAYLMGSIFVSFNFWECAEQINRIIDQCFLPNTITFIPVISIENGENICRNLQKLGKKAVFFSATVSVDANGEECDLSVADLKELASSNSIDVLITSAAGFQGLDLKNLRNIIPLAGSSYKGIIQTIGRSARGDSVRVAIIHDEFNYMFNRQMETKESFIMSSLQVEKVIKVKIN